MKSDLIHQPTIALVNIRSAFNVGSLIRSSDAVAVANFYCLGYTPLPLNPKVTKTSIGATVAWQHHCDPLKFIQQFQANYTFIALESGLKCSNLYSSPLPDNTCFLVGNEVEGLSIQILSMCQGVYQLPQHGQKESLNVAIAGSLALYEYRRRYPLSTV